MKNLTFASILSLLFSCSHTTTQPQKADLYLYEFPLKKYSKLIEGGFSGLSYQGLNEKNELVFWTHTDRGANAESFKTPGGETSRPFVQADFNPHIIKFTLQPETKHIHYIEEIPLKLPDGKLLTGLPNLSPAKGRTGDEYPVTIDGKKISHDLLGIDPEGICILDQNIWMVEEYGPSILKFDLSGTLISRYVPKGYYAKKDLNQIRKKYGNNFIQEILPEELLTRRLNRGFEGVACTQGKIYATLQSPLPGDDNHVLILELNLTKNKIDSYRYPLDSTKAEKIGDLSFHENKLYIIEQNSETGPESFHQIFEIDVPKLKSGKVMGKKLVVDLVKLGFDFTDKVEGLTVLPNGDMYILNDNDFGLTGPIDPKTNEVEVDSNRKSVLGLIKR